MSTGQRLNMIGTYLDHLQVAINHEVLKLITAGRTPQITDTGYYLFWWRVNSFAPKIENAIKQLKSIDHQLAMRRQGLRGLPRDQRYSARQSVDAHERHLDEVYAKARKVVEDFAILTGRGQKPTDADLLRNLHKLIKDAETFAANMDTQALVQQIDDHFDAPDAPGVGTPSLSSITLLLTVILLYIRRGPKND